jgi:hypothetical protein
LAVVGVLVVAACASREPATPPAASETSTATPAVVPWVDRPAPPYVEPTPTPTTFPTDAHPCRGSDLTASAGDIGAAAGTTNIRTEFTNHAGSVCVLLGYPSVAGVSSDGAVTALDAAHGSIIDDVVVEGNGEIENVAQFDAVSDCAGPATESAHNHNKGGQGGWGYREAAAVGEHADCGYLHRAGGEVDPTGAAHHRIHRPVCAGDAADRRCDRAEQASGGGAIRVGFDRSELISATSRMSASRTTCTIPNGRWSVGTSINV